MTATIHHLRPSAPIRCVEAPSVRSYSEAFMRTLRSAEVSAFDLLGHVRKRQTINVVRSTCAKLRRPI